MYVINYNIFNVISANIDNNSDSNEVIFSNIIIITIPIYHTSSSWQSWQ